MSKESPGSDLRRRTNETGENTTTDDGGVSRRKLMAAGAAGWATVGLAGCSDNGDTENGGDETTEADDNGDVTVTTQTTATATTTTTTTTTTSTGDDTPTTTEEDGGGTENGATTECTQSSVFAPGMDIGFLVDIYDEVSGDKLDEETLATVTLSFPHADLEAVELTPSGPHEDHVRDKWGGKVSMPADAEPGTYKYEIEVARDPDDDPEPVVTDEVRLIDHSL